MEPSRMFLAFFLMVGLSLAAEGSPASFEESSVRAKKQVQASLTPVLFSQLTSAAQDKPTTSGGWVAQCRHLSDDLEKSWNLTVVAAEANWPVVEDVAEILYTMLLNCTKTGFGSALENAECLIKNLVNVKNVILPAVKMNFQYVKQAWNLIPDLVQANKECFTF